MRESCRGEVSRGRGVLWWGYPSPGGAFSQVDRMQPQRGVWWPELLPLFSQPGHLAPCILCARGGDLIFFRPAGECRHFSLKPGLAHSVCLPFSCAPISSCVSTLGLDEVAGEAPLL